MTWDCRWLVIGILLGSVLGCHRYTVHEMGGTSRSVQWQALKSGSLARENVEEEVPLTSFDRGLRCFEKGEWSAADTHFKKAVSEEDGTVELYDFLGLIAWKRGHIEEARTLFQRAMRLLKEGQFRREVPSRDHYRKQLERRLRAVEIDLELSNETDQVRELDEERGTR